MSSPAQICSHQGCHRLSYESRGPSTYLGVTKCIIHERHKDPREFRDFVAGQIREWRRSKTVLWDFSDFVFVDYQERHNFFRNARFPKSVSFRGTIFAHYANFGMARFCENADFGKATFSREADFAEAKFERMANFGGATFAKVAVFGSARFKELVSFLNTTFTEDVIFGYAAFAHKAEFFWATFKQNAYFGNATVEGCLSLRGVHFGQTEPNYAMRFRELVFGDQGTVDFRDNDLNDHCAVIVRDYNIGRMLFAYTDVQKIRFENVDFEQTQDKLFGFIRVKRRVIGDEWVCRHSSSVEKEDKPQWTAVEITYERFAKAFRDSYNHPAANDCERGYFEARRNAAWEQAADAWEKHEYVNLNKRFGDTLLIDIYKHISHYSGHVYMPIVWFVISVLFFALAYHFTSLSSEVDPFGNALSVSLRIATFKRGVLEDLDNNAWYVYMIAGLQTVATAAFATFFVLALRRKFKHGD